MNKILRSIIFTSLFLAATTASCNLPSSATQNTETPILTASAPTETATAIVAPTEFIPPASATPQLAPLCEANITSVSPPAQCQIPMAEEGGTFCARKKPYNLIFINKGATYEVLTRGFRCSNDGIKNGRQIISCTGIMTQSYEVNVCDPACLVPTVQAESTQCLPGYTYDNLHGCCTQGFQQAQQNCAVLKLKTISCLVDCSAYIKKATCNQNYVACSWNDSKKQCESKN